MSGRKGASAHQNLIRMASKKLMNSLIGDDYLNVVIVREQPLKVRSRVDIQGARFGSKIVDCEQQMYADIAAYAVFNPNAKYLDGEPLKGYEELAAQAEKKKEEGDMENYYNLVRTAYGVATFIVECEINPRSHLLRDGARLTGYKLLKQKNSNLILILAVFEGTQVDNPEIFDEVWYFPKKSRRKTKKTEGKGQ